MLEMFRKRKIMEKLTQLVLENEEYSVAQLLCTIMRDKNNNSETMYEMTDENFSSALQATITELNEIPEMNLTEAIIEMVGLQN